MKLCLARVRLGMLEGRMGLLRTVILGRKNGLRAGLLERVLGDSASPRNDSAAERTAPPPVAVGEQSLSLGLEAPKDVTPPEGFEVVLHKDNPLGETVLEVLVWRQKALLLMMNEIKLSDQLFK